MIDKVLLVEPDFPYANKSKNRANHIHRNFVPIGLLKLGALYKAQGAVVQLVRGNHDQEELGSFRPSHIFVTSLFTYWSEYVWEAVVHYRKIFPDANIIVGGIYATLHSDKKSFREKLKQYNVGFHAGLHPRAEGFYPDYSLLDGDIDHHVTHTMRGCIRRCAFCGVWKIEPVIWYKAAEDLTREIKAVGKNKVIFFDNNFLAHKQIREILSSLPNLKINGKPVTFECQSGLDGRLLENDPELAQLLKRARFRNIRIAWDNSLSDFRSIKAQLEHLIACGYKPEDVFVFMIYNHDVSYEKMLKKLEYCAKWGVQIADCRYRPLDAIKDGYNAGKHKSGQTEDDYYIHAEGGWTDQKIRDFRRRVRQHNIWIRYAREKGLAYDHRMEKWSAIHTTLKYFHMGRPPQLETIEGSPTWKQRIQMLNTVRSYYQKNNLNSLDFSVKKMSDIDEALWKIIRTIEATKKQSPPAAVVRQSPKPFTIYNL